MKISIDFLFEFFFRSASQSIHVKTEADEDHEVYRWHSSQPSHKKRMRLNDFHHFMLLYIYLFFSYQSKLRNFQSANFGLSPPFFSDVKPKLMYEGSHQPDVITYNQILCAPECHNMLHDDVTTYTSSIHLVYRHSYLIKMTNT